MRTLTHLGRLNSTNLFIPSLCILCCIVRDVRADIGVFVANRLLVDAGHGPAFTSTSFHSTKGVLPRGTLNTIFQMLVGGRTQRIASTSPTTSTLTTSAGLVPQSERGAMKASLGGLGAMLPAWSKEAKIWSPPGFMASINTPVVHASAAALGYGGVQYRERLGYVGGKSKAWFCGGLGSTLATLAA